MATYLVRATATLTDGQTAMKFFDGPSARTAMQAAEAWGAGLFKRGEAVQVHYAAEGEKRKSKGEK